MADILNSVCFKGNQYSLPQECFSKLQAYMDKYEALYLCELLGAELYELFIAELAINNPPIDPRFKVIYDAFIIDEPGCIRKSEGIKTMLTELVYFEFVRDLAYSKTTTGVQFNINEVSRGPEYNGYNDIEAYNEGVYNYHEIQWYICDNSTDYPEYNGQSLKFISGI
jgi:hypothetical protein